MLETITIKNIASFDNVGIQINELKKVNFFFGFNGTGKSTIVKYLQNLSLQHDKQLGDFSYCSQVGYDISQNQILTFNEVFTNDNFIKNKTLNGVFSLNQKNKMIDEQIINENSFITKYNINKEILESRKQKIDDHKQKKNKSLIDFCWSQRQKFDTFSKIKLKYPGSKEDHFFRIKAILQTEQNNNIPTLEQLFQQYQSLYEKENIKIEKTINVNYYKEIRETERKLMILLQEIIIGNEDVDIANLINTLKIRNWVEQGVELAKETNGICPFCQKQTIDEDLIEQFEKYFDETYKQKIDELQNLLLYYQKYADQFLHSLLEIQNMFNPNNILSKEWQSLRNTFDKNIAIIKYKIQNSNERKDIISINVHKTNLSKIIKIIEENNNIVDELENNKITFTENIWHYMSSQCKTKIDESIVKEEKYKEIMDLTDKWITKYEKNIDTSKHNIEMLRSQTKNSKEAVDNINLLLKSTGFEGFEIAERGNNENNIMQYYLKRDNSLNDEHVFLSLSEGEKNFVSFLYFHQLCIGTDDIHNNSAKKKIIVIDDPVSSLDSQALFVVSSIIHNLILRKDNEKRSFNNENIEQVFILTHNIYFYKEVSFDRRPFCKDYSHYRIIKQNNKTSIINDKEDKKVLDDYSLLWKTIKDIKENMPLNQSLNILISNILRRIIDSYVNFIGLGNDAWGAVLKENKNEPSYYIKCAFISTINDESHKISLNDTIYYQKIIHEQPQILFDVFKEIFMEIGKDHYELMMR